MQKYGQSSSPPPAVELDLSKQIGECGSHQSVPSPGSRRPSGDYFARLDYGQSRKRPRTSGDGNRVES